MCMVVNKQYSTDHLDGVKAEDQAILQEQTSGDDCSYLSQFRTANKHRLVKAQIGPKSRQIEDDSVLQEREVSKMQEESLENNVQQWLRRGSSTLNEQSERLHLCVVL